MKAMKKSLAVNRVIGSLRRRTSGSPEASISPDPSTIAASNPTQTPEASARASVRAFCESGGNVQGDEILFLPPIVDAAESSPAAAAECANVISKFLDKSYNSRPSWQYNALMLVRILTDNPGETFTRNLGGEFPERCRKLLKHGRDARVRRMLMETLDDFERTKSYDDNLTPLIEMWKSQKEGAYREHGAPTQPTQYPTATATPPANPHSQNYFARSHKTKPLPDLVELTSRLEEARTSAKLLEQVVMNTPPGEMLDNELIKEFADRCQSASRSIQGYMLSTDPVPDNDTMESLIDTNEQLQTALNQHQRAVLNARKQLGLNNPSSQTDLAATATAAGAMPAAGSATGSATPATDANGQDRVMAWQQSQAEITQAELAGSTPDDPYRFGNNDKGKGTDAYTLTGAGGPSSSREPLDDPFRDPQDDEPRRHPQYDPFQPGLAPGVADGSAARAPPPGSEDDDLYGAQNKSKDPMYRY